MLEPPRELDAVANKVIGAALEVHRHLGPGFLESVSEEALHKAQLISYVKAASLPLGLLINFNEKWLKDGVQRIVLT